MIRHQGEHEGSFLNFNGAEWWCSHWHSQIHGLTDGDLTSSTFTTFTSTLDFYHIKTYECILYNISIWNTIFQSAAAAPSPVLGNLPPGDGMPVGPVPPGFFQVWSTHVDNVNSDRKSKAPFHPSVLPPTLSKREEEKSAEGSAGCFRPDVWCTSINRHYQPNSDALTDTQINSIQKAFTALI